MLFAGQGAVRMVKNCDLGRENAAHFQPLGHSFSSHGPPGQQITYIYAISIHFHSYVSPEHLADRQFAGLASSLLAGSLVLVWVPQAHLYLFGYRESTKLSVAAPIQLVSLLTGYGLASCRQLH